jgi:MFS family permease
VTKPVLNADPEGSGSSVSTSPRASRRSATVDSGLSVESVIASIPKFGPKDVRFANWLCFFAWVAAVYDFILFANLLPVIGADFGLTEAATTGLNTWVTLGTAVVAYFLGRLVDRYGRRAGLIVAVAGAALASLLTATTHWIYGLFAGLGLVVLVLVRTVAGLGFAEMAVNATYLNEVYAVAAQDEKAVRRRGFTYSLVQAGWPVGAMIAAFSINLLMPIGHWYLTFVVAAIPAIFIVWAATKMKESPLWAAHQGIKNLVKAGRSDDAKAVADHVGISMESAESSSPADLFRHGNARPFIFIFAGYLLQGVGVMVFQILATSLMTSESGMNIDFTNAILILIVSNVAAFLGYLGFGWLGDRIGRRLTISIGWILAGIVYGIMLMLPQGAFVPIVIAYAVGMCMMLGPFAPLMFFAGESFPSKIRATATSIITASGMIGNLISGTVVTIMLTAGMTWISTAWYMGVIPLVLAGLFILGAPHVDPKVASKR